MKGKLIVIDGLDGSGKNTQTTLLFEHLSAMGKNVKMVSFPDYDSPSSALVKMYLDGAFGRDPESVNCYAASTFFAVDRFASFRTTWQKDYENGAVILANRYTTANAIHQLAKLPPESHREFLDWLYHFEFELLGLPAPDRTIFLEVPVEKSLELIDGRGQKKDIHENREHLEKAYRAALTVCDLWHWHKILCVDREQNLYSIPEIADMVWEAVKDLI